MHVANANSRLAGELEIGVGRSAASWLLGNHDVLGALELRSLPNAPSTAGSKTAFPRDDATDNTMSNRSRDRHHRGHDE